MCLYDNLDDESIELIEKTIMSSFPFKQKIFLISTPHGKESYFWKVWKDATD